MSLIQAMDDNGSESSRGLLDQIMREYEALNVSSPKIRQIRLPPRKGEVHVIL